MKLPFHSKSKPLAVSIKDSSFLPPELVQVTLDTDILKQIIRLINPKNPKSCNIVLRGGFFYPRLPFVSDKRYALSIDQYLRSPLEASKTYMFRKSALGYYTNHNQEIKIFVDEVVIEALEIAHRRSNNRIETITSVSQTTTAYQDAIKSELEHVLLEELIHSQQRNTDINSDRIPFPVHIALVSIFLTMYILSNFYPTLTTYLPYAAIITLVPLFISLAFAIGKFLPYVDKLLYPSDPQEKDAKQRKQDPTLKALVKSAIQVKLKKSLIQINEVCIVYALKKVKDPDVHQAIHEYLDHTP